MTFRSPRRAIVHIAGAAALALLVAGCVYAPPPGYAYAPGYAYSPYAYAYPAPVYGSVSLGFWGGGWHHHRWH
jgi:hypothetical protein